MDGLEATKKCRELGITIPIIALSAESGKNAKDEAKAAGVNTFLVKPVLESNILNALLFWKLYENAEVCECCGGGGI